MKKNIISKAWDNRYGVLMVSELAENLSGQKLGNELYLGANVQEEVGLVVLMHLQQNLTQKYSLLWIAHQLVMFMVVKVRLVMEP